MEKYLYIALFAPLLGSLFAALFANRPKLLLTGVTTSVLLGVSMIASLNLLFHVFTTQEVIHVRMLDWIVIGNVDIPFGFIVDPVSATMMCVWSPLFQRWCIFTLLGIWITIKVLIDFSPI